MARSGTDKLTRLLCPPTLVPAPAVPHASAAHNASKPVSAPCMTLARLLRVSGDDVGDHHRHAFAHRNVQELVRTMFVGVWAEHAGNEELRLWKFFAERRSEEHTSELQSLMRISYAVFCLKQKEYTNSYTQATEATHP